MKLKFDANQDYQLSAIASVVDLFNGQQHLEPEIKLEWGASQAAIPNELELEWDNVLANLKNVQEQNQIEPDKELQLIEGDLETAEGKGIGSFPNFSIEMETGTGKTYVYIRTVLELYRRFGMRKFIVVVPSIAVREGVFKALKITEEHLKAIYGNPTYRYYMYDSANPSQIRNFALSNGVEIMVMTLDSFNKSLKEDGKGNVIFRSTDKLQGEKPINLIQNTRPILILDEPQNMESEKSVAALAMLNPLFALRYSATHRNPYNVIYRLTPFDAYRQSLVKRIEVASVLKTDEANQAFLELKAVSTKGNKITASLAVHKLMKDGTVKQKNITVKPEDDLEQLTELQQYAGLVVDEIDIRSQRLTFTNGLELTVGDLQGADKDAIFEAQIRYTIEEHMRKAKRYKEAGIKVLSLFFIDKVANYDADDAIIRKLFDKAYLELCETYPEWKQWKPEEVQAAYFSKDTKGKAKDTRGNSKDDKDTYDLIMKNKELLLSFESPVAFIFSHSALREGWDNPNVFQICTLNQTASDIKKRQEIGRGVRLAVNQDGTRIHEEKVNVLTVVANESYEQYVATLQSEIEAEYGTAGLPPKPPRAGRVEVKLRKQFLLKPEFKALWEKIKHKTRYAVAIDTDRLVKDVLTDLDKAEIAKPRVEIVKADVNVKDEAFTAMQKSGAKSLVDLSGRYPLPNLVDLLVHQLEHTSDRVRLTRKTLARIICETKLLPEATSNPQEFARVASQKLKEKLADELVKGIQYEKLGTWYKMEQFTDFSSWEEYLVPAKHSLFEQVAFDSDIEKIFAEELDHRDDVSMFVKLPGWFTVPTPVGDYNPDWAIVKDDEDGKPVMYLVRETKGTHDLDKLHPDEKRKILCGEKHFKDALGVDYKVAVKASEI